MNVNDGTYYYDIDEILNYVLDGSDGATVNTDITDMYGVNEKTQALELVNRQINETKANKNDSNTAIKYDLVKNFIASLSDMEVCPYNMGVVPFSQEMIFNTLIHKGFIKFKETNGD